LKPDPEAFKNRSELSNQGFAFRLTLPRKLRP
jgi:hypothetical protein